jgi:hypothetical protein
MTSVKVTFKHETSHNRPLYDAIKDLADYYGCGTKMDIDPKKGTVTAQFNLKEPADKEGIKSALDTYGFKKYDIC